MRNRSVCLLTAVALCSTVAATQGVMLDMDFEANVKVTSAYIWRGIAINDEACIQPSVTARTGDMSINVWGTWDLTSVSNAYGHTRMDTTFDYTRSIGRQTISGGVIAYVYRDDVGGKAKDTFEAYLGYALDVPYLHILPTLTVYYDFADVDGIYASFALARSFELIDNRLALDIRTDVGAGDEAYAAANYSLPADDAKGIEAFTPASQALLDLTAVASLPITITERFEITPGVKYTTLLNDSIKDATIAAGGDDNEISYDISLSVYF